MTGETLMLEYLNAIGLRFASILSLLPPHGNFRVGDYRGEVNSERVKTISLYFPNNDSIHLQFRRDQGCEPVFVWLFTDIFEKDGANRNVHFQNGKAHYIESYKGGLDSDLMFAWDLSHIFNNLDWVNVVFHGDIFCTAIYSCEQNYVLQFSPSPTSVPCHPRKFRLPPVIKSSPPYLTTRLLSVPVVWSKLDCRDSARAVLERFPLDDFIQNLKENGYSPDRTP